MSRRAVAQRGDKAAFLALIGICLIFITIVGRGWQTLLSAQGLYVSVAVGAVIAIIATALAYAIAAERIYHPTSVATAAAYFFVLFNLSALGTVNAMFVMFQSGNIFREQIDNSTKAVILLRDVGGASIDTASYDKFRSDVNDKWRNLKAELENPQLCGQGPVAASRVQELQLLLPNFRSLSGGGNCTKVPLIVSTYEQQIERLVRESSIYSANAAKLELKAKVLGDSRLMLDDLAEVGKLVSADFRLTSVKAQLFEISERYAVVRDEVGAKSISVQENVPLRMDVKSISALGDIGQVLPFLVSRLSDLSTYFYLLIALVLDMAVILAFARVLREGPTQGQRALAASVRKV